MKQQATQQFVSECGRAKVFVENEMPIGIFHDFLMQLKGLMVERMVVAHKEQQDLIEAQKALPEHPSECDPEIEPAAFPTQDIAQETLPTEE